MELGSTSVAVLATSPDHSANPPPSNPMVSSLNTLNSSSGNQALPPDIPSMHDSEKEICNGVNASIHETLNQELTENGDPEAERNSEDTLQQTCNEHEFVERQCNDSEARDVVVNFEPVGTVTDEHAGPRVSAEKLTSAAKAAQRVRPTENPGVTRNVSRWQTFYMIRMPRAPDGQLRSKIKLAELQLEEASKTRDVIRAALQLKRASKIGLLDKLKVVREKERACKDMFQKKRLEIDPFQAALNKFKFADTKFKEDDIFSEEDLDNKISRLQHRIQHESIPLKEEKQLIREIKQLESQRNQVCANDAEHALLLESYGPKEDIQVHLDILYRELDVLRAHQHQARLECEPIEKELENLNIKVDDLVEQLEVAKRSQVAALTSCRELKKCLSEQNAEFYRNKDDIRKAKEFASSKNLDDLAALCHKQVESVLRCWNSDSGFRERYMKNNERSTLRRLETLDGRSLGPDEEPLLLTSDTDFTAEALPKSSEPGFKQGSQKEVIAQAPSSTGPANKVKKPQENVQADKIVQAALASIPKEEKTKDTIKSEGKIAQTLAESTKLPTIATVTAPVEDAAAKEAQAAERKEKRRQEEIAKAKEAADRKRRQAERAQAKAQLRLQREAERREKEREKKARKKAAVGTEDVKPVEVPMIEERKRELVVENPLKDSVKGSSSQGKGAWVQPPKSRRHSVVSSLTKRKMWQVPSSWLWASLAILGTGLALVFVTKF